MMTTDFVWGTPKITSQFGEKSLGRIVSDFLNSGCPNDVVLVDIYAQKEITKGEYLASTIKLAEYLKSIGISRGDVIGIIAPNSWKYMIPVLSAFYLGVTTTCSNPNYLKDDLQHFLETSKPKILFLNKAVNEKIQPLIKEHQCVQKIILFDDAAEKDYEITLEAILSNTNRISDFSQPGEDLDDDVALVLFSSGTTGLSKGVLLTQRAMKYTLNVLSDPKGIGLRPGSVFINVMPMFHIFGFMITLICFTMPEKLILIERFEPNVFLQAIQDYQVTFLPLVPAVLQFFAKSPLVEKYDLSSVNDILCGSAPAGPEIEQIVSKRLNNVYPRQLYGATEVCGPATCNPPDQIKPSTVGIPIAGMQIKIFDSESKEVLGPYESGEVLLKSDGVMKGYLKNEDHTKMDLDDEGYLHSGDLGYFDEDGYLFIVGRIKEVIKYKGFQVAPAQLEAILLQHPAVKDVGVVGKPDERSGELPTALVVQQPNENVSEKELVDFVKDRVNSEKQLHGGVIFVEEIPRNTVQKIDRNKLRKLVE